MLIKSGRTGDCDGGAMLRYHPRLKMRHPRRRFQRRRVALIRGFEMCTYQLGPAYTRTSMAQLVEKASDSGWRPEFGLTATFQAPSRAQCVLRDTKTRPVYRTTGIETT